MVEYSHDFWVQEETPCAQQVADGALRSVVLLIALVFGFRVLKHFGECFLVYLQGTHRLQKPFYFIRIFFFLPNESVQIFFLPELGIKIIVLINILTTIGILVRYSSDPLKALIVFNIFGWISLYLAKKKIPAYIVLSGNICLLIVT